MGNELPADNDSFVFILILAVLHHVHPEVIQGYVKEFKRVLKSEGKIVVIEPCFFEKSPITKENTYYYLIEYMVEKVRESITDSRTTLLIL